tara:strand:+ start:529 stop:792 length:264 start_codon:yes stop_codon:yes gene_type:complete
MGWLVWYTLASMIVAFIAIRILELFFAGLTGGLMGIAKPVVFCASWTAVTAQSGMRRVTSQARQIRHRNADMQKHVDAVLNGKRSTR